jgi:hypothetical protein
VVLGCAACWQPGALGSLQLGCLQGMQAARCSSTGSAVLSLAGEKAACMVAGQGAWCWARGCGSSCWCAGMGHYMT